MRLLLELGLAWLVAALVVGSLVAALCRGGHHDEPRVPPRAG